MPLGEALGGGEEMLRQLLHEGRYADIAWSVAFLRPGALVEEVRALGIPCQVIDAGRFRHVGRRIAALRGIAAMAKLHMADLVVGWMVAGQVMAGSAALLAGLPCAWYQVSTPRPDLLDRLATLLPARGVLTLSRAGLEAQARLRPRRPVTLVHPGVPLERLEIVRAASPVVLRERLGLPTDRPVVGIVGRLQRWKGMHVFVDAVAELRRSHPAAHGVIVGGAHETEPAVGAELRAQAATLGLADAITFAGFQPNAAEWMQAMDVVVHASRREPFGIVVVEAMALGKPVVAGAEGGPAEIITHGVNGLLVPYGDAAGIARQVARLLDDRAFAARLGSAAQARATEFGAASYAARVVAAFRAFAAGTVPERGAAPGVAPGAGS
jgi:glycosyltransferase involved in cell wall biosynthesis